MGIAAGGPRGGRAPLGGGACPIRDEGWRFRQPSLRRTVVPSPLRHGGRFGEFEIEKADWASFPFSGTSGETRRPRIRPVRFPAAPKRCRVPSVPDRAEALSRFRSFPAKAEALSRSLPVPQEPKLHLGSVGPHRAEALRFPFGYPSGPKPWRFTDSAVPRSPKAPGPAGLLYEACHPRKCLGQARSVR